MRNRIRKILEDDKAIFYFVSVLFFVMFSLIRRFGDDVWPGNLSRNANLLWYWRKATEWYFWWASRIFVNLVGNFFMNSRNIFFGAFVGLSIYILMYSLSRLFVNENKKECNSVIACLVMLFPFQYMPEAGWIATIAGYLSPIAFGFLSLIPIKKFLNDEKFSCWEYIIYSVALIYGANIEQMMVVILGAYIAASIYFIYIKRFRIYCRVQLWLAIASCLNTLLCPGNYSRLNAETITWFKNFGMFNAIDKIDLGYSLTMQWLLFGSHIFVIFTFCLFSFVMWKKYKSIAALSLIGIPTLFMILFGPLRSIMLAMYPNINGLVDGIERNGLVTVVNRGGGKNLC